MSFLTDTLQILWRFDNENIKNCLKYNSIISFFSVQVSSKLFDLWTIPMFKILCKILNYKSTRNIIVSKKSDDPIGFQNSLEKLIKRNDFNFMQKKWIDIEIAYKISVELRMEEWMISSSELKYKNVKGKFRRVRNVWLFVDRSME